ncbi:DUF998 domain-containing protein [Mycobacterium sp. NPDC006124]|uniref:DUF998 domain-containing protein n=1 Tax=Mycobacterium sp. NPDC006124 TaxID=3156729 RepID=UPI0033BCD31E
MTARVAAACWLVAGLVYLGFEAIAAAARPGYRYAVNFISDLGRPDSPLSAVMNTAFAAQGTLFLAAALTLTRAGRARGAWKFVACAAANAVGNVVVALVPSGGAGIAWVHVTAATVAIVGGNAAILAGHGRVSETPWYGRTSVGLATLGLLAFLVLAVGAVTTSTVLLPGAVWERASVYTIIGWQLMSALVLVRR